MLTKQKLAQAWKTFSDKMAELRKKRQDILVAYNKEKTEQKITDIYEKIVNMPKE